MRSKRPWKKHARIDRVEYNSGDIQFVACPFTKTQAEAKQLAKTFESLTDAEAHLDAWWKEFWPKQVKSRRTA